MSEDPKAKVLRMAKPIKQYMAQRANPNPRNIVRIATTWWRTAVVLHMWFGVTIEEATKAVGLAKQDNKDKLWTQTYTLLVNQSPQDLFSEIRFNPGVTTREEAADAVMIAGSDVWEKHLDRERPVTLGVGDAERILMVRWPEFDHPTRVLGELKPPIGGPDQNGPSGGKQ